LIVKNIQEKVIARFKKSGIFTAYLEVSDGINSSTDFKAITIKLKEVVQEEETEEEVVKNWQAKCVRVVDGDTIELDTGKRIRYIGINCSESGDGYGVTATKLKYL
jgi:endonuclease YncB( thermonuclease family)